MKNFSASKFNWSALFLTSLLAFQGCRGSSVLQDDSSAIKKDPFPRVATETKTDLPDNTNHAQERGNGGKAVVCRDASQKITTAELLDFYEAENIQNWKIEKSNEPMKVQLEKSLHKLVSGGPLKWTPDSLEDFSNHFKILNNDVALEPTHDSTPVIARRNCAVEQVANYLDESAILVDGTIWKAFSETDKAGLVMHEALYAYDRNTRNVQDSDYSRKVNALAFSDQSLDPIGPKHQNGGFFCSTSYANSQQRYEFSAVEFEGHWRLEFFVLQGATSFSKTTLDLFSLKFPLDVRDNILVEQSNALVSKLWAPVSMTVSKFDLLTDATPGGNRGYISIKNVKGLSSNPVPFECEAN